MKFNSQTLNKLAIENKVACVKFEGNRFDCGSVSGFVKAINFEADRQKMFRIQMLNYGCFKQYDIELLEKILMNKYIQILGGFYQGY